MELYGGEPTSTTAQWLSGAKVDGRLTAFKGVIVFADRNVVHASSTLGGISSKQPGCIGSQVSAVFTSILSVHEEFL
jgi:hypothetical protein